MDLSRQFGRRKSKSDAPATPIAQAEAPTDGGTDSSSQNRRRGLFRRRRDRHEGSGEARPRGIAGIGASHSDTESHPRSTEEEKRRRAPGARSVAPMTRRTIGGGVNIGRSGAGNGGGIGAAVGGGGLLPHSVHGSPAGASKDSLSCPIPQPLHRIRSSGAVGEGGNLSQDPYFLPPLPLDTGGDGPERPSSRGDDDEEKEDIIWISVLIFVLKI